MTNLSQRLEDSNTKEKFERLVQSIIHSLNDLYAQSNNIGLNEEQSQVIRDYCSKSRERAEKIYDSLEKDNHLTL